MSIVEVSPSAEELAAGALSPENLALANRALVDDGIVVLAGVVPLPIIEALREKMLADVELLLARPDKPFNWNSGNLQQNPPYQMPWLYREVLSNDIVIQVTHSVLGSGLKNAFYSGNTALPSPSRQPVHADSGQLWPAQEARHPAYSLVVNLPLVDVSAENGSTEVWPGTHRDLTVAWQDGDIKVSAEALAERAKVSPGVQPVVKAGSMVIRDIRLWHAGMPNHTDRPRPMAAMIHSVSWWDAGAPLEFPKGSEHVFEHQVLHHHVRFVDKPVDHIAAPGAYDYDPANDVAAG